MNLHEINLFLLALRERGYAPESNRMAMGHAAYQFWKGVNGPDGNRLYTIEVRLHDRAGIEDYDVARFGRWGVSYRMRVNYTTSADVDGLMVEVMHPTMEVAEWERRCAVLWGAMKDGFVGVAPQAPARNELPGATVAGPSAVSLPVVGDAAAVPNAEDERFERRLADLGRPRSAPLEFNAPAALAIAVLGYFRKLGRTWMLTERQGEVLRGVFVTPNGFIETGFIHEDAVDELVLLHRDAADEGYIREVNPASVKEHDDYCIACWNTMPVGETCAVCGRVNIGER